MHMKTTLYGATNTFSQYPVVLFALADRSSDVAIRLAKHAVAVQARIGIPEMQVIENIPFDRQSGFECATPELGFDLIRSISLLASEIGKDADCTQQAERLAVELSNLWKPALNHHGTQAAVRLGIPWQIVTKRDRPLVALGQGVHRRLFWRGFTPATSEIGVVFSTSKSIMGKMLHEAGLPVPKQGLAATFDRAHHLATKIGWPVVVKPARTDYGVGITTGIHDVHELRAAYDIAKEFGDVLVQEHIEGDGHRLLVYNGKCIAAVRQKAAQVIGDGVSSVSELITRANQSRTDHLSRNWKKIEIDDALVHMLHRAGLELDSIPHEGQVVLLRSNTNISQGGTCERIIDEVHPGNKAIAEAAAAVFGLDLAGIDIQTTNIRRPLSEIGGAIIEVNSTPGLFMLEDGTSLEDQIIQYFFPAPERGRIPIIVCVEDEPNLANLIATYLSSSKVVAKSTLQSLEVNGHIFAQHENLSCWQRTQTALNNPLAEIAVISVSAKELLQQGLGIERVSLTVAAQGIDQMALKCLDRSSEATLAFSDDVQALAADHRLKSELWCLADQLPEVAPVEINVIVHANDGTLQVRQAGGANRELHAEQALTAKESLALQIAALICQRRTG